MGSRMKFPLMYDRISKVIALDELARGPLQSEQPLGVTIHYSADRNIKRTFNALKTAGSDFSLGYHLVIDRDGEITQFVNFNRMVYHAGKALWNGNSPNRTHISVCLLSWGEVKKDIHGRFFSWSGCPIDELQVSRRPYNTSSDQSWWDAATESQENSLRLFLLWCIEKGISIENIVGHDEVALPRGRKVDPGGVLSTTMADLREWLTKNQKIT